MGLGAVDDVTLAEVRAEREKWRDVLRTGADPIEERAREKAKMLRRGLTFGEAADAYIAERLGHYKRARHREAWKQTLDAYAGALRPKRSRTYRPPMSWALLPRSGFRSRRRRRNSDAG